MAPLTYTKRRKFAKNTLRQGWILTVFVAPGKDAIKLRNYRAFFEAIENDVSDAKEMVYFSGQAEATKTDRPHAQCYVFFKNAITHATLCRRLPFIGPAHVEPARGTPRENTVYTTKRESRLMGLKAWDFVFGTEPKQGDRVDLRELFVLAETTSAQDLWRDHAPTMARCYKAVQVFQQSQIMRQDSPVDLRVYVGATGCGKSRAAHFEASEAGPGATKRGTKDYYIWEMPQPGGMVWVDDVYMGQEHVVIDDYEGEIPYRKFLRMTDEWGTRPQTKGSHVEWRPKIIWISTNVHPNLWYPEKEGADTWTGIGDKGLGPLARRISLIKHFNVRYVKPKKE